MIGVIGGSGLYNLKMANKEEVEAKTPFGKPSDKFLKGKVGGKEVVFLARHGRDHTESPSTLNYRANIFAMKALGVERIISIQAVGSLKEEFKPRDLVIPDQMIDFTLGTRPPTFFTDGIVAHVGFADPFCKGLSDLLYQNAKEKYDSHLGGTYICMEGPMFSTRAESNMYRKMGAGIVGMTGSPEARLAREAEICYAAISTVTDYDVWKGEDVSVEMIIANAAANEKAVLDVLESVIPKIPDTRSCQFKDALAGAIMTKPGKIPEAAKKKLEPIIGRYL